MAADQLGRSRRVTNPPQATSLPHLDDPDSGVVLIYHGLSDSAKGARYLVSAADFKGHLERIRQEGLKVVPLKTFWSGSGQAVVLTFDDGLASDYEAAFPLLLGEGVSASFFLNTANIGKPRYLSWSQIVEMAAAGMSFQSHSHDHVYLTRLPRLALERQLVESRQLIEDRLGIPVEFISAPYGELNARVLEAAHKAGYQAICTSRCWPARAGAAKISRVPVYGGTTPQEFQGLLTRSRRQYYARAPRELVMWAAKRLILPFVWQRIQAKDQGLA